MPDLKLPKALRSGLSASHRRAPKMEKETATRLGGRITPGSGNQTQKGDVRVRGIARVECKTTKHKSFSVTDAMITKIEDATFGAGEVPAMQIELGSGKTVWVVPDWGMDMLLDRAKG